MKVGSEINRLGIGTVQFGTDYGIANKTGQASTEEIQRLLAYAYNLGIDTLDTAISYGDSEKRLGEIGVDAWKIITKLPGLPGAISTTDVREWLHDTVTRSLERLNVDALFGLLLHKPSDLLEKHGQSLYDHLLAVKEQGRVQKIGISVYSPQELGALFNRFPVDLVQLPFNILDQRFADSGWLTTLKGQGIEIHSRSVFLQGLLLIPAHERPLQFKRWQNFWIQWDNWLKETGMSPMEACLNVAFSQNEINRFVVGFDNLNQLKQICNARLTYSIRVPTQLKSAPEDLINPLKWAKL